MSIARRIAIVCPNFYPRVCGVGDHSARLAAEFQGRGHDPAVFSRSPVSAHPAAPQVPATALAGRWPLEIARSAAQALRAWGPTDLLLQYTPQMWGAWRFGSPAALYLAAAMRARGVRVTVLAHELYIPLSHRPDLAIGARLQRLQFAGLMKLAHRVFVTTDTRAEDLRQTCQMLGVPAPRVVRVPPNTNPIVGQRPADAHRNPRIGLFSTAAAGKRFDVVLSAFEQIVGDFPGAELVIIGDLGDPGLPRVRAIQQAVSSHPAGARIVMTGRQSLEQIAVQLANLDLYLFPMDTGANTRSGTLPAALGTGLPVVAIRGRETDPAVFRDGENIVFAPELTGPAFAEASLRLLRDPASMQRIGRNARATYEASMTWEHVADQLLAD